MGIVENGINSWVDKQDLNEKKGPFCPAKCLVGRDGCPECKRLQDIAVSALNGLRELEHKIKELQADPAAAKPKEIPSACSFCGAPIENGAKECPYCLTKYDFLPAFGDIPEGYAQQEDYLLETAAAAYQKYVDFETYRMKLSVPKAESMGFFSKIGLGEIVSGLSAGLTGTASGMLKMTPQQFRQGAEHYGVCYSEYIAGMQSQKYKCVAQLNMEHQQQVMHEQTQRSMEIERERQEKLRKINQERGEIYNRMFTSNTPKYNGGSPGVSSNCCGSCAFYDMNNASCSRTGYRENANGYCAYYKYR